MSQELVTIRIPKDAHALAVEYCKRREVPINLGSWVGHLIREKIKSEKRGENATDTVQTDAVRSGAES